MHLLIGDTRVPYEVVKKTGRHIRLSFSRDASVLRIEAPGGQLDHETHAFVQQKSRWILQHYQKRQAGDAKRQHFFDQVDAGKILYQGEYLSLEYVPAPSRRIQKLEGRLVLHHLAGDVKKDLKPLLYGALRALAKTYLSRRTLELAQATNSSPKDIRIKDHKSKWGSCSSQKNINLNWHLILLPPVLIDYVIIHELMHLREMNHSPAYWACVEQYVPDYKAKRNQVKAYGWVIGMLS